MSTEELSNADGRRHAVNSDPEAWVLGVDGGGTKTVAWLATRTADESDLPVGVGFAGPGNPRAVGFDAAQASIAAAVIAAFKSAGVPGSTVAAACLGLAGAGRSDEQERIREWAIASRLARHVIVTSDAAIILAAGASRRIGVALICGTGSFAWGRNAKGETARTGGWGYLMGDEGSAYAVALAGLQAAGRAADGRGPPTALLAAFQQRLDAATPQDLIGRIYRPEMSRERIAELATVVFDLAATDAGAGGIVEAAAAELSLMVSSLARKLGFAMGDYDLVLTGGVITKRSALRERIVARLRSEGLSPGRCEVVTDAVRGAVSLARE